MNSVPIVAGLAREEDTDRILELNVLEYGSRDILATREDFAWRHDQNPAGAATIAVIRNDRNEVVGFIWAVPLGIRVRGVECLGATGTNLVIHPEHRNTFAYTKLIRRFQQILRDNQIPVHYSFVSEERYRRQRTADPQSVATIPLLAKPLNFKSLAEAYFVNRWQRFVFGRLGSLAQPLFTPPGASDRDRSVSVQAVDGFDSSFDDLWRRIEDRSPAMVIRDRAFLAWRFASVSGKRYHVLVAHAGDQMLGYTVLRCATIRRVKAGLVMDLLTTGDSLGEMAGARLMVEAEAYFRAQGMALAAGLMVSSAVEYRILRRAGYRPVPRALAPRVFRFALFVHDVRDHDLTWLSARDWFITLADHESL
jgi:hypothetical protein